MVNPLSSVLLALCLLFLVTADGRTMQAHVDDVNVASSNTSLLDSTSSSTTNSNDVAGLITLIRRFSGLTGVQFPYFSNDPCYPQKLTWIECSNDDIRRVTALYLGVQNLYGQLPDFSSMDALETIDLQRNSLFGPIPGFLGTFPELTYLDLANNFFAGPLPDSLANNKKIKLNLAGNPMCSSSNACSPPAFTQFPPPTPRVEYQYPPPTPTVEYQYPLRPTPRVEYQFPLPPTPRVEYQFPLPPTPRIESQFPSGGGGGGGGGGDGVVSFDLPDTGRRRKKSKLPAILGGTIPPSLLIATVVYAISRRRRNPAAGAANFAACAADMYCCCCC